MNKAILMGRLTRDPELRETQSNIAVSNFTIACDRRVKEGEEWTNTADFIDCVAWRGLAKMVSQYFQKGSRILVEGHIQPRDWVDKEGNNRRNWEVVVSNVEFCESGSSRGKQVEQEDEYSLPFDM